MRIQIKHPPRLKQFILISVILHIFVMTLQGIYPDDRKRPRQFPPIKVSYLPPEKKPEKVPQFVDAPQPRKVETPKTSERIAKFDSRAHNSGKLKKRKVYQNKKTAIPRSKKSPAPVKKSAVARKKKIPPPKTIKQPYRPADKGLVLPGPQERVVQEKPVKQFTGGSLALLEGFDPEKYAAIDTHSQENTDDGEVISLDTRESKYASYFARIKEQIEHVWSYPSEAERRGLAGRLTLRFQISKDGNLMNVRLVQPSGSHILDDAALQAVKSAAPYYPFPVTIDKESLSILATFIYSSAYDSHLYPSR
ncbi:MAG: TonB family protein [Nitrospinaceae bacterium]|nr:energy transducer TonB [Nitrospinaceae bacterium]NIR53904.1 energy transducer TonB [Nitrospinaceae bacterium]NIS84318.1 energy transducer TonB [Nitrospinaceae bacterium]NIT81125.1 energy transducer TonB [Nitrospinaceae bacterium]NIW04998.1 TonB family protein [Nitrospinaceae bacterium]